MITKVASAFLIALIFFVKVPFVKAESPAKFDLKTETVYQLTDTGSTKVTINYSLTNLSSAYFASQYAVQVDNVAPDSLKAFDGGGALQIQPKSDAGKAQAIVTFKNPVAGIGKVQKWTVSYESNTLIKKNGSLFQIMLPPPAVDEYTTNYTVVLKIPEKTAKPVSFSPPPGKNQSGTYSWSKDDLKNSGIYSVFSTKNPATPYVAYDFKLSYKINNPKLTPVNIEVPLPPDTNHQKIFLKDIYPRPIDVRVDPDGNWLAKYYLGSNGKLEITTTGQVALFQKPTVNTFVPKSDPKKLIAPDQFWETDNSGVKVEAKKYFSVKEIYVGVLSILRNRQPEKSPDARRAGAQYALLVGNTASGQDYTDLFVTLVRARNVPAREVIGIIPSSGTRSPQLQSWAQYQETETGLWHMVDPSLEAATKGLNYFSDWDLNHFALVIRGQSSTKPFFPNYSTKDSFNIQVSPSDTDLDVFTQARVSLRPDIPLNATAGFPITGKLFLENTGPTIQGPETIKISSSDFEVLTTDLKTDILPPFSSKVLDLKIKSPNWLSSTNGTISLITSDLARDFKITVKPVYASGFVQFLTILVFLGVVSISIQITRAARKKS